MHRTRHSSLDCLSGGAYPQDEWSEFLSTSMMALSTADSEARSVSPTRLHHHHPGADISFGRCQSKPRGMSMSEGKMSSLPSNAWRPLGRRVASPPPTLTSSPEPLSPPMSIDNQSDDFRASDAYGCLRSPSSAAFGSSSSLREKGDAMLKHVSSFRKVASSCLSSSASSINDSSNEEEQHLEPLSNQSDVGPVPAPPSAGVPFAEGCLPVLSQLPRPPRTVSMDGGSNIHANSLVKSPVLGSRKDAQTWQLQDEEYLMTSPRFGSSFTNGDRHVDLFRGSSVSSLLSTYVRCKFRAICFLDADMACTGYGNSETRNQYDEDYQGYPRSSKDTRASSVDFTFERAHERNPPLPPPQEPLQRSRARSFSYSQAYGPDGYNPFNGNKPFAPVPHHRVPPQQATGPEISQAHRTLYPGSNMMQPPHTGVRLPRVSIPTDSPMHQFQYGPPMPYRRYSDAFAVPPYQDFYPDDQQENQSHQNNTGRGMRSYSIEYGNYTMTRQMRSQSMEGLQIFASAPPLEYPSLNRSNSAGGGFDWLRKQIDLSPPLPPDMRGCSVNGTSHFPPPPPEAYYDVEFKRGRQEIFAGRASFKPGEYVKVEADRGEDIGRIVQRTADPSKIGSGEFGSPGEEFIGRCKRHDLLTKKIICVANQRECDMLNEQRKEEHEVYEVCKSKVRQRLLPMNVIDAEYQFDRHKLTFFFEADRRIDFRELVRDLFAIYKTRIWLQQVVSSGKKAGNEFEAN